MGKASRGKGDVDGESRRDRVDAMREADASAQRKRNVLWSVVGIVLVGSLVGLTYWGINQSTSARDSVATDVTTFPVPATKHVVGTVNYPQTPPVGGDHDGQWLNCGIYDAPVASELAVHALEHGAVWVTYDPALSAADVQSLRDQMPSSYIVLSPYDGLDAPVVASAWGVQLKLDSVDDPRLKTFLDVYRQGNQTPEPGAACDGGVGTPIS